MKNKYQLLVALIVIVAVLAVVPIKTRNLPNGNFSGPVCQNVPLNIRVDLVAGNTLQKETNKLGQNPCPTVKLKLYVL